MQTPAERHLIETLRGHLLAAEAGGATPAILNIGAGKSAAIEAALLKAGCRFVCDRVDVGDCAADSPVVRDCIRCSVEDMTPLKAGTYAAAFANYVLEHVRDLDLAASEVSRVLKPGGIFVASVPNLTAPEFIIAHHAPGRLKKLMTRGKGFDTCYSWTTIHDLAGIFQRRGMTLDEVRHWAFTQGYLEPYPVAHLLSRLYDTVVQSVGARRMMGNVCITLRKQ